MTRFVVAALAVLSLSACSDVLMPVDEDSDASAFRAPEGSAEAFGILSLVNDPATTYDVLDLEVGLDEDRISFFQPMLEAVGDVHWSLVAPGAMVDADAIARLHRTRAEADAEIDRLMIRRREQELGLDDALGRRFLLEQFGIEVGGGLGPMAGKVWRIGLMGYGCQRANVELCLRGVAAAMAEQGLSVPETADLS